MVEVRIAAAGACSKFDSEVHRGMLVLRELRGPACRSWAPLFPLGVERGKLEVRYDELVSDEWVWRWVDA